MYETNAGMALSTFLEYTAAKSRPKTATPEAFRLNDPRGSGAICVHGIESVVIVHREPQGGTCPLPVLHGSEFPHAKRRPDTVAQVNGAKRVWTDSQTGKRRCVGC